MLKSIPCLSFLVLINGAMGCAKQRAHYIFTLDALETEADAGPASSSESAKKATVTNGMFEATFGPLEQADVIPFFIKNTGSKSFSINWNKASYVDLEGRAMRLIKGSVRVFNIETATITPTTVPPGATVKEPLYIIEKPMAGKFDRKSLFGTPTEGTKVDPIV